MEQVLGETTEDARAAYESGEMGRAYRIYKRLMEEDALTEPVDLANVVQAGIMMGDNTLGQRAGEKAYTLQKAAGNLEEAGRLALWMLRVHMDRGEHAIGMAWLRKAERDLEQLPKSGARAGLEVIYAFVAHLEGRFEEALERAARAESIAREAGDVTELALALNRRGRTLIRLGRLAEGQKYLDEAMTYVTVERTLPAVTFIVYCSTIDTCVDVADYDRAAQWTDAANDFCARGAFDGAPGICRVHRAELLRLKGDWAMAEREALAAATMLERVRMGSSAAHGYAELGMVRLQAGDFDRADEAFRSAHSLGYEAQPGLALLRLRRGNAQGAASSIARSLAEREGDALGRAKLLPAQVEIALSCQDFPTAERAVEELEATAERFESRGLAASALKQRGALELARGSVDQAIMTLRKALAAWCQLSIPYEVADIRRLLAVAHEREGDSEQAAFELETARRSFEVLGATVDVAPARSGEADPALAETMLGAAARRIVPGTVIDKKIEVVRALGEGAMGAVFEAKNRMTGRAVALKMVHPELVKHSEHKQRLLQEALACGKVRHPNVVDVYDAGEHEGLPYLVLELLEGEALSEYLKARERLEVSEAVKIGCQVLDGIQAAHEQGVVHRDLKPQNIFLSRAPDGDDFVAKVLDFGLSKLGSEALAKTEAGTILGTPYYMAPEQIEADREVSARCDIYSIATVLFELLVGEPPFMATTHSALMLKILRAPFPSATHRYPEIPEALSRALQQAGAREPEARYASAREFRAAIEQSLTASGERRRDVS